MENLDTYLDENLSNFEGDSQVEIYTGADDDLLNFSGGQSFANEVESSRIFIANIKNDSGKPLKLAVLKGYEDGESGVLKVVDGNIPDPEDSSKIMLVSSGTPSPIVAFQEFVKHSPVNLIGLRIQSEKADQLQGVISFFEKSPFHNSERKDIFIGTHINENTYKENMVTIPTPGIILGPETQMNFDLLANTSVSITFFVGAVLSSSSALRKKRNRAIQHIKTVGLPFVRQREHIRKSGLTPARGNKFFKRLFQ